MKLRYKLLSVATVVGAIFLFGRCSRSPRGSKSPTVLPDNVAERVSVKNGVVTVQTPTSFKQISGVREGVLLIMKDGTSKLDIRTYGFEHQLGMNGFINADGGALGLDVRYFYYKNFDTLLGMGYAPLNKRLDIWAGIGYTIHTSWMSNTTIFIGYSLHNNPIAGISVRF